MGSNRDKEKICPIFEGNLLCRGSEHPAGEIFLRICWEFLFFPVATAVSWRRKREESKKACRNSPFCRKHPGFAEAEERRKQESMQKFSLSLALLPSPGGGREKKARKHAEILPFVGIVGCPWRRKREESKKMVENSPFRRNRRLSLAVGRRRK